MTRRRALITGAAMLAAALTTTFLAVGAANAESNGGVRVMPLGDSITEGTQVPGGYRIGLWQTLTSGGYKIDFVGTQFNGPSSLGDHDHQGHPGWRIDQIDANIVTWLRSTNPRTVLLHIGTNDILQNNDVANAPAKLSRLVDRITATAPDAEVFVATLIPISGRDSQVRTFNAAIPAMVSSKASAGKRVHLVDMYPALTTADLLDGIHPSARGYGKMATVWYDALRRVPRSISESAPPTSQPPTSPPPTPQPSDSAPPNPTPSVSPSSPPPTGQPAACAAAYRVVNSWGGGFQAEVSVHNGGSSALNGWTVRMTLASGQSISNLWSGVATGSSGAVSVRNAAYNGTIPSNGSTTFGFVANGNGSAMPTGVACSTP